MIGNPLTCLQAVLVAQTSPCNRMYSLVSQRCFLINDLVNYLTEVCHYFCAVWWQPITRCVLYASWNDWSLPGMLLSVALEWRFWDIILGHEGFQSTCPFTIQQDKCRYHIQKAPEVCIWTMYQRTYASFTPLVPSAVGGMANDYHLLQSSGFSSCSKAWPVVQFNIVMVMLLLNILSSLFGRSALSNCGHVFCRLWQSHHIVCFRSRHAYIIIAMVKPWRHHLMHTLYYTLKQTE